MTCRQRRQKNKLGCDCRNGAPCLGAFAKDLHPQAKSSSHFSCRCCVVNKKDIPTSKTQQMRISNKKTIPTNEDCDGGCQKNSDAIIQMFHVSTNYTIRANMSALFLPVFCRCFSINDNEIARAHKNNTWIQTRCASFSVPLPF